MVSPSYPHCFCCIYACIVRRRQLRRRLRGLIVVVEIVQLEWCFHDQPHSRNIVVVNPFLSAYAIEDVLGTLSSSDNSPKNPECVFFILFSLDSNATRNSIAIFLCPTHFLLHAITQIFQPRLFNIGCILLCLLVWSSLVGNNNGFPTLTCHWDEFPLWCQWAVFLVIHCSFLAWCLSDTAKEASPWGSPMEDGPYSEEGSNAPLTLSL